MSSSAWPGAPTDPPPLPRPWVLACTGRAALTRGLAEAGVRDAVRLLARLAISVVADLGADGLADTAIPPINQEVVVLVDEGIHWFDLRAVYVRGHIKPAEETEADTSLAGKWFELVPTKTTAWDYGTLREA